LFNSYFKRMAEQISELHRTFFKHHSSQGKSDVKRPPCFALFGRQGSSKTTFTNHVGGQRLGQKHVCAM